MLFPCYFFSFFFPVLTFSCYFVLYNPHNTIFSLFFPNTYLSSFHVTFYSTILTILFFSSSTYLFMLISVYTFSCYFLIYNPHSTIYSLFFPRYILILSRYFLVYNPHSQGRHKLYTNSVTLTQHGNTLTAH